MSPTVSFRTVGRATRAVRTRLCGGLLVAGLLTAPSAQAAITFVFDYLDNAGTTEFLGPGNQNRRDALESAGSLFSNYFGSLFSNSATITLGVQGTNQSCASGCTLAFAGTQRSFSAPNGTFGNSEVIYNKLVNGTDLNGAGNDGVVGVNWGAPWELDPNVSVAAQGTGNFDLYAALFHEFTHAIGFASSLNEQGTDGTSRGGTQQGGVDYAGYWSKFDQFLTDCAGTDLIDHGTGLTNQATYDTAKTSSVCFVGANALAGNGTGSIPMYTPNPYEPGSSVSHLLEQGANTGAMMKYDRNPNVDEARTYNATEIGVLMDLGYTRLPAAAVSEPGTIALALAAMAGIAVRRRRRR